MYLLNLKRLQNTMHFPRVFLKAFVLFLLLFNFTEASQLQKVSLQLIWKHQFQFAGYYMAKEKGFYKDENLDVTIKEYDFGMDVVDDVLKGKTDFAVGRSSLIHDKLEGKNIVMLASILQHSPIVLLSLKTDAIQSIKDLKNKKIMLTDDTVGLASIEAMLLSSGIKKDMYKHIPHSFNINDLIDSKTDAIFSSILNEPFALSQKNIPFQIFSPKEYGFDFYSDILFTSQDLIDIDKELVSTFKSASLKGWKYAIENIDETVALILKKYNTQSKTKEALQFEAEAIVRLIDRTNTPLGSIDESRINQLAQTYKLMGLVTKNKSLEKLIFNEDKVVQERKSIFDAKDFLETISTLTGNTLYNLDLESLQAILQPVLRKNTNIKALSILESLDNELVFTYFLDEKKAFYNEGVPQDYKNLKKQSLTVTHSGEDVGKVTIYYTEDASSLGLNKEEKKWIKENIVKIGVEQWEPIVYSRTGTDIDGIVGDYLKNIITKTGLKVEIVNNTWDTLLINFKNQKIDLLPNALHTEQRTKFGLFTTGYFKVKDALYFKETTHDIRSLKDLEGKTLAIPKGNGPIALLQEKFPKINLVITKNLEDSIAKVLSGEATALYDVQIAVESKINKEFIKGLESVQIKEFKSPSLRLFSNKDKPVLHSILQKGLNAITYKEKNSILSNWIDKSKGIDFSQKEQEWLDKDELVRYVYDPDWAPFEWQDELGQHTGIVADILEIISSNTGIHFIPVKSKDWSHAVEKMKTKNADMFSAVAVTTQRAEYVNFTSQNIYSSPGVIVSRKSDNTVYIDIKDALKTKNVGLTKDYAISDYVQNMYPNLSFIKVNSIQEGFVKLENEEIDAFIINAATAQYYIKQKGFSDSRIAAKIDFTFDLKIALQKSMPAEVLSILDKSIERIPQKEIDAIYHKWTHEQVEQATDWTLILEIMGVVSLVLLFNLWNNHKLKTKVKEKTKDIKKQKDKLENLLVTFDSNVIFTRTDLRGVITHVSDAFCEISGYSASELLGKPHSIVRHPDMPKEAFKEIWDALNQQACINAQVKNLKKRCWILLGRSQV